MGLLYYNDIRKQKHRHANPYGQIANNTMQYKMRLENISQTGHEQMVDHNVNDFISKLWLHPIFRD